MTYQSEVLTDAPLAWWGLADTGSTFADSSGNGRALTITGAPTRAQAPAGPGIGGASAAFSGTGQYASIAAPAWFQGGTLPAWSVECWVKTSTLPANGANLVARDSGDVGPADPARMFNLGIIPGGKARLECYTSAGGVGTALSAAAYNNGAWHHIVGTFNAGALALFADGASVATATLPGTVNTGGTSALTIASVRAFGTTGDARVSLNGGLDEVALYGTALSPTRVAAHYDAGLQAILSGTWGLVA